MESRQAGRLAGWQATVAGCFNQFGSWGPQMIQDLSSHLPRIHHFRVATKKKTRQVLLLFGQTSHLANQTLHWWPVERPVDPELILSCQGWRPNESKPCVQCFGRGRFACGGVPDLLATGRRVLWCHPCGLYWFTVTPCISMYDHVTWQNYWQNYILTATYVYIYIYTNT